MPVPLYTPSNFAMIAGDEMSASNNIPVAFGYYAQFATIDDILNLITLSAGSLFFGLRRDGSGAPLTSEEKQQPSATLLLPRGTIILINGKATQQTAPPAMVPYILYVVVTSEAGADTTYETIYSWLP